MSKKIFINNIDSFVSRAVIEELTKPEIDEDGNEVPVEDGEGPAQGVIINDDLMVEEGYAQTNP